MYTNLKGHGMLSEQTSRGAKLVVALILAAILIVGVAVSYIRFGGPLHKQNLLQDELLADILPPPAFVVEPYLHATWSLTDPAHAVHAKAELAPAYLKQPDAVEHLVERSTAYRAALMENADRLVFILIAAFASIACAVLAIVLFAARMIRQRVVAPLVETAGTMQRMAEGDYRVEASGAERNDEIGVMARAIVVFRENGMARAM